jgi:hypothetical protein
MSTHFSSLWPNFDWPSISRVQKVLTSNFGGGDRMTEGYNRKKADLLVQKSGIPLI